jgi:hypothetical protein
LGKKAQKIYKILKKQAQACFFPKILGKKLAKPIFSQNFWGKFPRREIFWGEFSGEKKDGEKHGEKDGERARF